MTCCGATRPRATRTCASTKSSKCSASPTAAIAHLRVALRARASSRCRRSSSRAALTVLALSRVAPWEANAPLELILDTEHTTLHRLYLDDDDTQPARRRTAAVRRAVQRDRRVGASAAGAGAGAALLPNAPARRPINRRARRRATRTRRRRAGASPIRRRSSRRGRTRRGRGAARARGHRAAASCGRSARRPASRWRASTTRAELRAYLDEHAVRRLLRHAVRRLSQRRRLLPQIPRDVRRRRAVTRVTSRSHRAG